MKLRKLALLPIASAVALSVAGSAAAVTFDYDFGTYLTGGGPGPTPPTFAHLSVTTADYMSFIFDLKIGTNLNTVFGSTGTFVSKLSVNTASNADPSSVAILPGSWGVATVRLNTSPPPTGGIAWDFTDGFCGTSTPCNPSIASSRLAQGEEVEWTTIFATSQNPPFGTPAFALKVQGYGNSAEYIPSAPVPEPETYAMMLAGLGLMGFVARRRQRSLAV